MPFGISCSLHSLQNKHTYIKICGYFPYDGELTPPFIYYYYYYKKVSVDGSINSLYIRFFYFPKTSKSLLATLFPFRALCNFIEWIDKFKLQLVARFYLNKLHLPNRFCSYQKNTRSSHRLSINKWFTSA
jgi:hypothetical protein